LALRRCQRGQYDGVVATLEDHEARIAALEASQADYGAVLAAVNALGANQRDHALDLAAVKTDVAAVKTDVAAVKTDVAGVKTDVVALKAELADFRTETRATFRSVDEHLAEIRDLIIGRRNGL
jgi:ABC-type transporter Mla subunit MlaD